MKRANTFKQNSRQWYAWRNKGLGASNAPTIMGQSPWSTRFQLWAEIIGLLQRPEPNQYQLAAMERGKKLEPEAREKFAKLLGVIIEADVNCEHEKHEFIRCSLDGWIDVMKKFVEIKAPNKEDHKKALKGIVPDKYVSQLDQQFLVVGDAEEAYYVSYYPDFDQEDPSKDLAVVPVIRNRAREALLEKELIAFWHLVQTKQPPQVGMSELSQVVEQLTKQFEKLVGLVQGLNALTAALNGTQIAHQVDEGMVRV